MARFTVNIYNMETEEVEKTCSRNIIPVGMYIKFQEVNEKLQGGTLKNDFELFSILKKLFVEAFPTMTEDEYENNTNVAEVLAVYADILKKATLISSKN